MAKDPELAAHLEWLGYIQPVGLVVSAPALAQAQAYINRNIIPQHQRFLSCLPTDEEDQPVPVINDLRQLVQDVLDWQPDDLIAFEDVEQHNLDVTGLEVVLPEYNETLCPTWVVPVFEGLQTDPTADPFASASDPFASAAAIPQGTSSESADTTDGSDDDLDDDDDAELTEAARDEPEASGNASRFVMLITQVPVDQDLDEPLEESDRRWHASPHARFERLLRESQVPAGLLTNGRNLRLVYAPRGETSGYLTFNVEEMTTVAGRPIFAALHMLLNSDRLFNLEKRQRLPAILVESRKYQNTVSTQLAQQVMAALYELLRGFQAANDQWNGRLLKDVLATNPQHVYHGLLTVLMRTVFILYAEDRNLLSNHPVYTSYYSIIGLFERLRSDAGQYPDTMDQRYGAWAQLLTLFRMIYEGGSHAELQIPPRKGYLFDPDRYPFLEGRFDDGDKKALSPQEQNAAVQVPRVPDGVVYRVLNNLLMLDGERISYRSLDVEQIGSVYEAIMGFEVEVSTGRSIAIKPVKRHGAPATINLEELLKQKAADRTKWLKVRTDQDFKGQSAETSKSAKSIEDLLAALEKKIANDVTPNVVPAGAMIFQPSDERRRSGSHYTPRSLTEPIVRTTLQPILQQLVTPFSPVSGEKVADRPDEGASVASTEQQVWQPTAADKRRFTAGEIAERIRLSKIAVEHAKQARQVGTPHPSQILDLKICDPAMGSGAFLVETCRQLGDELIKAWYAHDAVPTDIPPDEDEVLYARRLVAQRCLYGVDKNDMAVDLAKLSLWLVTLAKDHPFTFLDHALRHGDSLVGLTRRQIIGFHWEPKKQKQFGEDLIQKRLDQATEARAKILNAPEDVPYLHQQQKLAQADEALNVVRLTGDACVSVFFAGAKRKEREIRCEELFGDVAQHYQNLKDGKFDATVRNRIAVAATSLRDCEHPVPPFHWEIEFPEVFSRENGGFDAFVGNPPFLGGRRITELYGKTFNEWLSVIHTKAPGGADLVAHFFRRAFAKTRRGGTFGFIATNSIAQGDTRTAALTQIRKNSGTIYTATKRLKWPGEAAVIVSVLHICKGAVKEPCVLSGNEVSLITAYLLRLGPDDDPNKLSESKSLAFQGDNILGLGFTFDDTEDEANTLVEMESLTESDPRNADRIYPYIDGSVLNSSPTHEAERFVICFAEMSEAEARQWPKLFEIVERRVKPFRLTKDREKYPRMVDEWWKFWNYREELYKRLAPLKRAIVIARVSDTFAFTMLPTRTIFHEKLVVFPFDDFALFAHLQSRVHETWARAFSSSLKDDLQYTPTKCTATFPFAELSEEMKQSGESYFTFRQQLMAKCKEGLTDIFNRMHDEHEQSEGILELRRLHGLMDRAVLEAYGWDDLAAAARCEFLLDYEEEDDDESGAKKSKKKKPWRLRWPDDFRDEVLARLLELNEQRHKEELLAGRVRVSGVGDRVSGEEEQEDGDWEQSSEIGDKKARKLGKPRKSKTKPAAGQQEMEF